MALSPSGKFSKSDYFRQAEEVGQLLRDFASGRLRRVCEVGCGQGFNIRFLAEQFPSITFSGVDLNDRHIRYANNLLSRFPNASASVGDFHALSTIKNQSTQVVFAVETLCHATDLSQALKAIHRTMGEGGKLVIFDGFRNTADVVDADMMKAISYTEKAMAVPEFSTLDNFKRAANDAV